MFDGGGELFVLAGGAVLGGVGDFDIGLELGVFEVPALGVEGAGLGDAEEDFLIDEAFPPDGGAGSGDGHADELADAEGFVGVGEDVGVGVVSFSHDDGGGAVPAEEGLAAEFFLFAGVEAEEGFAAEEGGEVFGEPAAAVEAGVDDEGFFIGVVAEDFREEAAEGAVIHAADVDPADLAVGDFFGFGAHAFDPAFVEEFAFLTEADGADDFFDLLALGVGHGEEDAFSGEAVEAFGDVFSGGDGGAVDLGDDGAGGDGVIEEGEGGAADDFEDFDADSLIGGIGEDAEGGGLVGGAILGVVAGAGVGGIELAEEFAEHFDEVVVVVDGRQKFLVLISVEVPIDSVEVGAVEFFADLTPDVLVHFAAFGGAIDVHFTGFLKWGGFAAFDVDLVEAAG